MRDGDQIVKTPRAQVAPTAAEVAAPMPGDDLVPRADIVMNRGFTVAAPPDRVWPWLVQLGKRRAGWYLPRSVERVVPRPRRAARHLDPRWQTLAVGDVVPDYGGRDATFTVAAIDPPSSIVYTSQRGSMRISWSILLAPAQSGSTTGSATRVRLRLRLSPVLRPWLARTGGELIDLLTVAGLAAGLEERLRAPVLPTRER